LFIIHHSSFIIHHSSFIIHHSSFIIHHSSFIIHHSSFIIHRSSFIVHRSSFIIHHSSFIVHHSPLPCPPPSTAPPAARPLTTTAAPTRLSVVSSATMSSLFPKPSARQPKKNHNRRHRPPLPRPNAAMARDRPVGERRPENRSHQTVSSNYRLRTILVHHPEIKTFGDTHAPSHPRRCI